MHVTNDQFLDKHNNGRKKIQNGQNLPFTTIIWPCGRDNLKSFSRIIFKSVMHVTNNQFLSKFNNGRKKSQNGRFIVIFRILSQ